MFAQHDCDVAHARNIASHAADNVFFPVKVGLVVRVKLGVVSNVVVAFRQKLR